MRSELEDVTPDEYDRAYGTVTDRHPELTGEELARRVDRVLAIMRYANHGPTWTEARR